MSLLLNDLLDTLPEGRVNQVVIGLHWTAVVVTVSGATRCGLASTISPAGYHHGNPDVPQAGQLTTLPATELARLVKSDEPIQAGIGAAAINALLPHDPESWVELNAEAVLATHGAGKRVALIGHFPFVPRLRAQLGELVVLEQNPQPGDLPAESAARILPLADLIAISGMTLINQTLADLLSVSSPQALVVLLGPTTPLSPVMYDYGIDILCGSVVTAIDPVLQVVSQGGNFRQVRRAGVKTVAMFRPDYMAKIQGKNQ